MCTNKLALIRFCIVFTVTILFCVNIVGSDEKTPFEIAQEIEAMRFEQEQEDIHEQFEREQEKIRQAYTRERKQVEQAFEAENKSAKQSLDVQDKSIYDLKQKALAFIQLLLQKQ